MCKSLDFLIVNGRKSGDIFGKFTSFQWNGSSTVDYVITSMASFDGINSMEVDSFYPWHCALKYTLSLNREIKDNTNDATASLQNIPPKFSWNAASQLKFKSDLQSESVKAKFESITENTSESSAEIVNKLTEILLSCADTSGLKQTHKRKSRLPDNPPWFDKDCKKLKSEVSDLAKRIKASPYNNGIRETLFVMKRKLHNRVRKSKTAYKNDILEKMHLSNKKEPKKFWRLLDKMNGRAYSKISKQHKCRKLDKLF